MSYESLCAAYGKDVIDSVVQNTTNTAVLPWFQGEINYMLEMHIASELSYGKCFPSRFVKHGCRLVDHQFDNAIYAGTTWQDILDHAEMYVGYEDYDALEQVLALHGYKLSYGTKCKRDIWPTDVGALLCTYLAKKGVSRYDELKVLVNCYGTFSLPTQHMVAYMYTQLTKMGKEAYFFEDKGVWYINVPEWGEQHYRIGQAPINYLIAVGYIPGEMRQLFGGASTFNEWVLETKAVPSHATPFQKNLINQLFYDRNSRYGSEVQLELRIIL